ncbi:hypothetical protein [Flavobacterium sp.]|uniref:hypothetical protein n=1 Tax=Flavobacterium sp. TaxID=239 RepID=UPI003D119681
MRKFFCSLLIVSALFKAEAQNKDVIESKYRRSSIYTVMINQPKLPYADVIKQHFQSSPVPDKFNDHNLGKRVYETDQLPTDGTTPAILNEIARDMVAKWFNRSSKGGFNMDLIKKRGFYDASALDIKNAQASKRGLDQLADAGEDLIGKTFVLINEFKYTDKEEVAKKASGFLSAAGSIGSAMGVSNASLIAETAGAGLEVAGKGYVVKTKGYLYQLVWDEETAATFYKDYWADDATITPEKKRAFDESTFFKLKYIGTDVSWADIQSTIFTKKTNEELVQRATLKSIDKTIVALQKNHDEFKTKTPIFTVEPITAKIGTKEGVTEKSSFDVLEQVEDENGKIKYNKVGVVKVDTDFPIWDNTYGAEEEHPESKVDRTYFKKVSGKDLFPGMLLVQRKGK